MDFSHILDSLNEAQRDAVAGPLGSALVLAGAGSGKTRVLTHRVAWLIHTEDVSPYSILAVTFTNKAAAEMRGRIESTILPAAGSPGIAIAAFCDSGRLRTIYAAIASKTRPSVAVAIR